MLPQLFKGIALFTPGGDLIYGIDPSKQGRWHLHLCVGLQEIFGLAEPPHFLVPGYTATIDRWLDSQTQKVRTSAEIYRPIQHHQALLNALFGTSNLVWQVAPWQEESCDPIVLETYRDRFPQLWEDHDLIVRLDRTEQLPDTTGESYSPLTNPVQKTGYPSEYGTTANLINNEADLLWSFGQRPSPTDSIWLRSSDSDFQEIAPPSQPSTPHSYVLRLFVSGNSATTEHTLKKLHEMLEQALRYPYTLKVIDVFKHPDQAEANQISATPTLLRVWPQPVRRIVGDLSNVENILRIIGVPED
ncbi:MAG TPA: circadian clock protein KaiB [Cyanobacteria bacterium UBA8803]|nr:circadian clock protein KaiB [Cyanobacteria bacterium UBA9273]HBL59918.1 circadian clock protein KaiB [Cyanobacteria bacterium UBA8803]